MKTKQERIEDMKDRYSLEESIKTDPDIKFSFEFSLSELILLEDFEIDYESWFESNIVCSKSDKKKVKKKDNK